MSSIIEQFKAGNDDPEVCNRAVVLIQYLCGLVRCVVSVCACVCVCVCTHACTCLCMCMFVRMYVCVVYVCLCVLCVCMLCVCARMHTRV